MIGPHLRNLIGTELIMWGSDFPHPEGTYKHGAILQGYFEFPEEDGRKILGTA